MLKAKCPKCKKINDIILNYEDLSDDLKNVFTIVICKFCNKKILVRKESEYVICANCKSTLLIEKDYKYSPPIEYANLTPYEYYLLLAKENSFNPYFFPIDSPYFLEPNFEKKINNQEIQHINYNNKGYKTIKEDNGTDHLYQTVKHNEMNITKQFLNNNNNKKFNTISNFK